MTNSVIATSDEYCFRFDEKKISGIAVENMKVATMDAKGRSTTCATKKNKTTLTTPAAMGKRRNAYSEDPKAAADNFTPNKKPGGGFGTAGSVVRHDTQ